MSLRDDGTVPRAQQPGAADSGLPGSRQAAGPGGAR